jgi:hypothetical protein
MSHQKPWAESMMYLMQLPGFGVITGMTVLAAIGSYLQARRASSAGMPCNTFSRALNPS